MTSSSRRRMSCGRKLEGRCRNAKHRVGRSNTITLVSPSFDLAVADHATEGCYRRPYRHRHSDALAEGTARGGACGVRLVPRRNGLSDYVLSPHDRLPLGQDSHASGAPGRQRRRHSRGDFARDVLELRGDLRLVERGEGRIKRRQAAVRWRWPRRRFWFHGR